MISSGTDDESMSHEITSPKNEPIPKNILFLANIDLYC